MKKLYIATAALALLVAAASCDRTDPFIGGNSFVTFSCDGKINVSEDAGTLMIPIRAIGEHGDFTVTVSSKDGTAISNTNYKMVEPASGVLNFTAADSLKNVVVELTHVPGYIDPGKWDFIINIDNATGGLDRGSRRSVAVTILDADHPLKHFIGTWTSTVYSYRDDTNIPCTIVVEPDANDITKLNFYDLCPYFASYGYRGPVVGVCSEDLMTMTIAAEQSVGYGDVVLAGTTTGSDLTDIVFTANMDEDTINIQTDVWGARDSEGWWSLYDDATPFVRQ